ncbi:MAG: hypothetical protein GEU80_00045 [Dehalococcoidia bacterium]|nr:hypothetical protein [Dehalococcoidia bacterium]
MPDTSDRGARPPFDYAAVTPEDVRRGCDEAIVECDRLLDGIVAVPDGERTFDNTLRILDEVGDRLASASGQYGFLGYVAADKELRDVAIEYEQKLDTYGTSVGFREDVYHALRGFAESAAGQALEGEEARLLEFQLRDYRRDGFELGEAERARIQASKERLVNLGVEFRRNIDEYNDALLLTREQLTGLPDSYIERLEQVDTDEGKRYRVSLDYPEMYPFMEAAEDGDLRRELFLKNYNKAAGVNLPLLSEAIGIRDEIATALGYGSWAHYVLETRMAKRPEAATDFLLDLQQKVRLKADLDIADLAASKAQHLGQPEATIEVWDWRYYQERVLKEEYEVDSFAIAEYFPLDATLDGLFDVYQRLVGVRFVPVVDTRAWHPDVRLHAVLDAASGEHIAHFYMDLHPRADKYGHAAAFTLRQGRERPDGSYQPPVSAIVANFTKPTATSPSLLRHSEVETLFHEFGHILHQVMTRSRFARFAGTNVERDFVEAPSQMLEHWVWEPKVLAGFTRHVERGEPLPAEQVHRMIAAKNVGSGIHYLRQIFFARLDLAYHGPGREKDTDALAAELHPVSGFPLPPDTHFQAGFGHLFGYDAGYYGYLWSQVFGDDMFTRFQYAPEGDPAIVGREYRELILEAGGTRDGDELLREFLGREPRPEAFLRGIGLDV